MLNPPGTPIVALKFEGPARPSLTRVDPYDEGCAFEPEYIDEDLSGCPGGCGGWLPIESDETQSLYPRSLFLNGVKRPVADSADRPGLGRNIADDGNLSAGCANDATRNIFFRISLAGVYRRVLRAAGRDDSYRCHCASYR